MNDPDTDFDPNDPGVPLDGVNPNDTPSMEDVLSEAWDKGSENEPPEGGNEPPDGGDGGEGGDPPPEGGTELQPMDAPAHWASADREMFAKQTPEAQKWLMERSNAMDAAHTQRSQEIAPIRGFMEKWDPYFRQMGADPGAAMNHVMEAEYILRTGTQAQKLDLLKQLIHDYGVEAPGEGGENAPPQDPRVDQLAQQMQELAHRNNAQAMHAQNAQMQAANNAIHSFTSAKNEDGTLAHPFFGDVQVDMERLAQADIDSGRQPDLKDLYDRACWANPTVRQKLLDMQKTADAKEARRKRHAGSSVSGAGSRRAEQRSDDLDSILSNEWDRQMAAA